MNKPSRRIALLIEIPNDQYGMSALRMGLLRSYGIQCLSIKEPSETIAFKDESEPTKQRKRFPTKGPNAL